jgi:hypothetical protein
VTTVARIHEPIDLLDGSLYATDPRIEPAAFARGPKSLRVEFTPAPLEGAAA